MNISNILSLIIWIGWLIYGLTGENKSYLRAGTCFGSIMAILFFLEKIIG